MKSSQSKKEYLLIDGYNIIFSWDNLKKIAEYSLEEARLELINILQNYQGYKKNEIILVFDAYKVENSMGDLIRENNINVVYTKTAQTADNYIEATSLRLNKEHIVKVATSDSLEQVIIFSHGSIRVSAQELKHEIEIHNLKFGKKYIDIKPIKNNMLIDNLDSETAEILEQIRLGKYGK